MDPSELAREMQVRDIVHEGGMVLEAECEEIVGEDSSLSWWPWIDTSESVRQILDLSCG